MPVATGVQVYCGDPHSPWQRATHENTNGLLRQSCPNGIDRSNVTPAQRNAIAIALHGRPRHPLGWDTPSDAGARVGARTA